MAHINRPIIAVSYSSIFTPKAHDVTAFAGFSKYAARADHNHPTAPAVDVTTDVGSASLRWKTTYTQNVKLFPPSSVTPATNGEVTFELTSNTTLTVKVKGSDGTVRSVALMLA